MIAGFPPDLTTGQRVLVILAVVAVGHLVARGIRSLGEYLVTPRGSPRDRAERTHPRVFSVITLSVGALTFVIYFAGIGLALSELGFPLTAYFASASVIGLAVGFGSQGLVQDVVTGLTLIFSDVLHVGNVVDIGGQTGRVERIGLRFTILVNSLEQRVYVPNRSIAQINRYRGGHVRVYVDVQIPEEADEKEVTDLVEGIALGMRAQYSRLVLGRPELLGVWSADPGGWRFGRWKFRVWPGQAALVEGTFVRRVLAALRSRYPEYQDWMVTVTHRGE
jgi:moderate conductance mechanosensitive channel